MDIRTTSEELTAKVAISVMITISTISAGTVEHILSTNSQSATLSEGADSANTAVTGDEK